MRIDDLQGRWWLFPPASLYGAAVTLRGWLYDQGVLPSQQAQVPTLCIGNLTAGGTGKTPMVHYCIAHLAQKHRVAMLSRGYGRRTKGFREVLTTSTPDEVGDEPLLVKRRLPDTPMAVCENRVIGCQKILALDPEVELIVLDDGYQHRALCTDTNILLTDFNRLFTRDHFLPYGRLRDGRSQRRRADAIVVTKCPGDLSSAQSQLLRDEVALDHQLYACSTIEYGTPLPLYPSQEARILGHGQSLYAVAAIAKPDQFFAHIDSIGSTAGHLALPDHSPFTQKHLQTLETMLGQGHHIITTEKDAMRLRAVIPPNTPLALQTWYIPITIGWLHNSENVINGLLDGILATD